MKYIKRQKVNASITDSLVNLSAVGCFQLVQDAVTELMGQLKIDGITAKREYNAVWVIIRNRIKFLKSPTWNDEIVTEGFISSKALATITLDVAIRSSSGELCAYARVEVCALDMDTGRIRRVSTVGVNESITTEEAEDNVTFAKFADMAAAEVESVRVRYTDIDFSRHTNNIAYVRYILNTYSVAEMEARPIKEMEMVYANQSYEKDLLSVKKASLGNTDIFFIDNGDKITTKCEIIF